MVGEVFTVHNLKDAPRTIGVYSIRNTVNGKVYIGSVARRSGFRVRWREHRRDLDAQENGCRLLQRAWAKHGRDAFVFEVLELVDRGSTDAETRAAVLAAEQRHLDSTGAAVSGYNILPTAGSTLGRKMTDEQRQALRERVAADPAWMQRMHDMRPSGPMPQAHRDKIGAAAKKRFEDPAAIERLSEAIRKSARESGGYGPERCAAISAANMGKKATDQARQRMSESHKARWTDEVRQKQSETLRKSLACPEAKERMAAAQRGRKHSPETLAKMREAQQRRYADPDEADRMREAQQRGAAAARLRKTDAQ
jgi:group I intron endonuclease